MWRWYPPLLESETSNPEEAGVSTSTLQRTTLLGMQMQVEPQNSATIAIFFFGFVSSTVLSLLSPLGGPYPIVREPILVAPELTYIITIVSACLQMEALVL